MNMRLFFEVASPTTLASLIADIREIGTGAGKEELSLEHSATVVLHANVGEEEAAKLIDAALGVKS